MLLTKLWKFALVGGLGTVVNEGVLVASSHRAPLLLSLALAVEVSILFNFALNDIWTFRDRRDHSGRFVLRLTKFHLSSLTGGIVQVIVFALLLWVYMGDPSSSVLAEAFVHTSSDNLPLLVINGIGILAGFSVRFITSYGYVWKLSDSNKTGEERVP